jgi:stage II sporulation protein R
MKEKNAVYPVYNRINVYLTVFFAGMVLFFICAGVWGAVYSNKVHASVSSGLIRVRVLANSDSPKDQFDKFMVTQVLLDEMGHWLAGASDIDSGRAALGEKLPEIEKMARGLSGYPSKAVIVQEYFPSRTYAGITLPAGIYETVKVTIGDAGGRNWWCVLFPPLCLVDGAVSRQDVPYSFEDALPAEAYYMISNTGSVRFRFKTVEIWQGLKNFFSKEPL